MTDEPLPGDQTPESEKSEPEETGGTLEIPAKLIEALRDAIKDLPAVFRYVIAMTILAVILIFILAYLKAFVSPDVMPFLYFLGVLLVVVPIVAYVLMERKPKPETSPAPGQTDQLPATSTAQPVTGPTSTPPAEIPQPTPQSPQSKIPPSSSSWKERYLETIITDCQRARLLNVDRDAANPQRGAKLLENVYITLDTTTAREEPQSAEKKSEERKARPLSALDALLREPEQRIVLTGLPGSGKSTFLRHLFLRHAQALLNPRLNLSEELPGWTRGSYVPLMLSLAWLATQIPAGTEHGTAELVEQAMCARLNVDSRTCGMGTELLATLKREGGVVGFDGLDEVGDLALRPIVREAVEAFGTRYPLCWCVTTCRTYSYNDPDWQLSWPRYDLAPLSSEKIADFVKRWYAESTRLEPGRGQKYQEDQDSLLKALRPNDRRRLAEIAPNPLVLTMMAVVNTEKGRLPDTRALVYQRCVELLVDEWELLRTERTETQKRNLVDALDVSFNKLMRVLQRAAYDVRDQAKKEGDVVSIPEGLLKRVLDEEWGGDEEKTQIFLEYARKANGLLMSRGLERLRSASPEAPPRHVYIFPHLSFGEYLAGCYLERLKPSEVRQRFDQQKDLWREPLMFLGEYLCFGQGKGIEDPVDSLLEALVPETPIVDPTAEDWRAVWMAGDLLKLYRRAFTRPSPHDDRIVKRLATLLESGALTPVERAAAGVALADLGDPRKDVTNVDAMRFCYVPGGPFVMGASKKETRLTHPLTGETLVVPPDPRAYDDEGPAHIQDIPSGYWMARYPITNAQFAAFVKDKVYEKPEWWNWSDAALSWWKENKGTGPRDYGTPFNLSNHPVVGVTWYEAVAFCRWLTQRWRARRWLLEGWEVRLSTEAEWEKAARGGLFAPTKTLCVLAEKLAWEPVLGEEKNPLPWRAYPWGDEPDSNCANYGDTGINTTSAVGAFPGGETPYGALEMIGNVWEWCAMQWVDNYENYDKTEANGLEGTARRVVRGGAFHYDEWSARCAYRYSRYPYLDYSYFGFRVCVAAGGGGPIDSGR